MLKRNPHTYKTKEKIRIALLGHTVSEEARDKMRKRVVSEKQKQHLRMINLGKKLSKETRRKMSIARTGIKRSEKTRNRISKAKKGKNYGRVGSAHPNWKGGISFEPYSVDWTINLRISIRERDKYTCKVCGEKQGDTVFSVHHIDYDKKNCNPKNLITVCHSCHPKTNFNRSYWINYFRNE